jgi:hypothetical protein
MFKNLEDGVEILRVQLERVALCEFLAEGGCAHQIIIIINLLNLLTVLGSDLEIS